MRRNISLISSRLRHYSQMDTRYGNSLTDFSRDLLLRDGVISQNRQFAITAVIIELLLGLEFIPR